jgi:hypothetical protein
MVEAIGGSARILYIPDCTHAFSEVYLGVNQEVSTLNKAIWAHYKTHDEKTNWHEHTNSKGETENWFIFDTAGGWFPGKTISDCMNASQVFYLLDCNRDPEDLVAPEIQRTEYGPVVGITDTKILDPGWSMSYWTIPWLATNPEYKWCHYKAELESLSPKPLDWYLTDEANNEKQRNNEAFNYYYGEAQVQKTVHEFDWDKTDKFYVIIKNSNADASITYKIQVTETCYTE